MKINLKQSLIAVIAVATIFLSSCSKDKPIIPTDPVVPENGVFILNEGAYQANNSSLSYLNFVNNTITEDIFSLNNPNHTLGSGVSDMDMYGSLLFIAVTESNKVEILRDAKVLKTITIDQPRFIAFHSGKAFVTSYSNKVFVIDTLTKNVIKDIQVGNTPEQIVTLGDRLYVANSGAHDAMTGGSYDNTLSVINPVSLSEESKITVANNVYHVFADGKGNLYANTIDIFNADWSAIIHPSRLYRINVSTKQVEKDFGFGSGMMAFYQDNAYLISTNYNGENGVDNILEMNLSNDAISKINYFNNVGTLKTLYGFSINPDNGDMWISDSDYINPGHIYHYNNNSKQVQQYQVGLNPSVFVFK